MPELTPKPHLPHPKRLMLHRGPGHYWSITVRSSKAPPTTNQQDFRRLVVSVLLLDCVVGVAWALFIARWWQTDQWKVPAIVSVTSLLASLVFLQFTWWYWRRADFRANRSADGASSSTRVQGHRQARLSWALAFESAIVIVCLLDLASAWRVGSLTPVALIASAGVAIIWSLVFHAWRRVLRQPLRE